MSLGKIVQVIGFVVDVLFAVGEKFFEINNVFVVYKNDERKIKIVFEVVLELGDGMVCIIVMELIDGLICGMEVLDIGCLIFVLVGKEILGRVFNVLGDIIDLEVFFIEDVECQLIYKKVLIFDELFIFFEIFEIGIKVIDFFVFYFKGGKVGFFGGVGVGKIVLI